MRRLLLAFLCCIPGWAFAQTGTFVSGHALMATNYTGVPYADAGGAVGSALPGQGYLTELGITATGTPFCINSALINAQGGYYQFCLGALVNGGGLISFNSMAGAPVIPLNVNINGTMYPFPNAGGGGGIIGPVTSTINEPVVWSNALGTAVRDGLNASILHTGSFSVVGATTLTGALTLANLGAGAQTSCLGTTSGGLVVASTGACANLIIGTTPITGGVSGDVLTIGGGSVLNQVATNGSGNVVLTTSPTLVTPNIGVAIGTSLTLSQSMIVGSATPNATYNLQVAGGPFIRNASAADTLVFQSGPNAGPSFGATNVLIYPPGGQTWFKGYISGTTLIVTLLEPGSIPIAVGQYVFGGTKPATQITGGSGTSWTVNTSQTVGSPATPVIFASDALASGHQGNWLISNGVTNTLEQLVIGSLGPRQPWLFSQVIGGDGTCEDMIFGSGISAVAAWTLRCNGTNPPYMMIPNSTYIAAGTPLNGDQHMISVDASLNLQVGGGTAILGIYLQKAVQINGNLGVNGSVVFGSPAGGATGTGTVNLLDGVGLGVYSNGVGPTGTGAYVRASGPTIGTPTISGNLTTNITGSTQCVQANTAGVLSGAGAGCGTGTVMSVALSVPNGSIFGVTGSPVTTSGTLGLTTSGTSGGLLYFSSATVVTSSAVLTSNAFLTGGGAGAAPNAVAITGIVLGNGASAPNAYVGTTCTNQVVTVLSSAGVATCSSITNVFLTSGAFSAITGVGTLTTLTVSGLATFQAGITATGLAGGTQVSCLGLDSGNHVVITGSACGSGSGGSGTVTSVGLSVPGSSIFGVTGSPVTVSGTLGLTTTGNSGGILYFSSGTVVSSTPTLTANAFLTGGGSGAAPNTVQLTGFVFGNGASAPTGVQLTGLVLGNGASAPTAYAGTTCTNQAITVLSAAGVATCSSIVNAFLTAGSFINITGIGSLTTNVITSGYVSITGTTLPPQAAGTLGLGGIAAVPTLGANGEGDFFLTVVGGLNGIGQGSTDDHRFLNKSGTIVANIPTGTTNLNAAGALTDQGTAPTGTAGSGYVRATSPTLVTPTIGVAVATSINGMPANAIKAATASVIHAFSGGI